MNSILARLLILMAVALSASTASHADANPEVTPQDVSARTRGDRYFQLSPEERSIVDRGEIGQTSYIVGGILGTYPLGLGIGHAIQGRYADQGWKFTVGELASIGLVVYGLTDCVQGVVRQERCHTGALALGAVGYLGFRIWEIIDVWAGPPAHNERYRNLKRELGSASGASDPISLRFSPIVTTQAGAGMGLQLQF